MAIITVGIDGSPGSDADAAAGDRTVDEALTRLGRAPDDAAAERLVVSESHASTALPSSASPTRRARSWSSPQRSNEHKEQGMATVTRLTERRDQRRQAERELAAARRRARLNHPSMAGRRLTVLQGGAR